MNKKELTENEQLAYDAGYTDGLTAYAFHRDGRQYVGSCGRFLEEAVEERTETYNYKPRIAGEAA